MVNLDEKTQVVTSLKGNGISVGEGKQLLYVCIYGFDLLAKLK